MGFIREYFNTSQKKNTWHNNTSKIFGDVAWNMLQRFVWTHSLTHYSLFVIHPPTSLKFFIGIRFIFLVKPTIVSLISFWILKEHLKVSNLHYRASWASFQTTTINMLARKERRQKVEEVVTNTSNYPIIRGFDHSSLCRLDYKTFKTSKLS